MRRIELPSSAWEAGVLPLNYTREARQRSDPASPSAVRQVVGLSRSRAQASSAMWATASPRFTSGDRVQPITMPSRGAFTAATLFPKASSMLPSTCRRSTRSPSPTARWRIPLRPALAQVVDRAIALFEDHVTAGTDGSDDALVEVVRSLLPAVTRLVAQHFNRTLVNRALDRVADGDRRSLADALAAADADRLEVVCRWP